MLERIWQWFDQIIQNAIWHSVLSHFYWIDWLSMIFVTVGVIYGLRNGFMGEMAEILELFIINYFVFEYYERVGAFISVHLRQIPRNSLDATSFILTAAAAWAVMMLIVRVLKKLIHSEVSKPLRYLGGMVLGALHLFFLLSFLSQAMIRMPFYSIKKAFSEGSSYSGYYLAYLAPRLYQLIDKPVTLLREGSQ